MSTKALKPWLSKWEVLGPVGGGGQGLTEFCIALAADDQSQRYVLKRLKRQDDSERRARMHREVSALRTLSHAGLPSYVDGNTDRFATAGIHLYFVMEYIAGPTLESAVRRQPFSVSAALELTIGLVEIVDHCHRHGVIHRDIKPDNIILRDDTPATPVLIDFGLTFNREVATAHETEEAQHLGNRFLFLPELRGSTQEKRDPRSDLTACCGVLYYALTGEQPTSLDDLNGAKPHQRSAAKRILMTLPQPVVGSLNSIFDQGFQVPIGRRWQSAEALSQALHRLTSTESETMPLKGDPVDRLARIRERVQARPERPHELRVHEVLKAINTVLLSAHRSVVSSLGDDFNWNRGGYSMDASLGVVGHTLGIARVSSASEGVRPRFEGRVTGTEVVVTATNSGQQVELLRAPLEAPIAEEMLQNAVIAYFTSELEEVLGA